MSPKPAAAGRAPPARPPELDDDDVEASDEELDAMEHDDMSDGDLELGAGEDEEDVEAEEADEGEMDDDEDDDEPAAARLKEAARRQQPAGPGPGSAAASGRSGGLVAEGALMMQVDTSDAAIMQMEADELLAATRASYTKASGVEGVLARLKEALMSIPEHEVSMSIAKGFVEALGQSCEDSLTIKPPSAVTVVGSYAFRGLAQPGATVDVAVQLPTDFLAPKAHLNHRYAARRAVYLLAVAGHLRDVSYSLYGTQRLEALHGDSTRPVLVLQPPKAEGFSLRLLFAPAPTAFALPRLGPDRNGVRAHVKPSKKPASRAAAAAGQEDGAEGGDLTAAAAAKAAEAKAAEALLPTPHYNAGIMEDMLLTAHATRLKAAFASAPRLLDGLLLLKVWARRHGLMPSPAAEAGAGAAGPAAAAAAANAASSAAANAGCLDGCVLSMLVLLLAERNRSAQSMSALQVFRSALGLLADAPAWAKGLALGRQEAAGLGLPANATPPPLSAFKAHHQVVFVDFTGWANVAAHMTRGSLSYAQMLARRTIEILDRPADPDEAFASALLTSAAPGAAFDYQWRVVLPQTGTGSWPWKEGAAVGAEGRWCRDRPLWREQEAEIERLVRQALTDRAKVVRVVPRPLAVGCEPDALEHGLLPLSASAAAGVWVGAVLDPLLACRLVDIGPAADDAAAASRFRNFWGDRAELRRWADGKITETAVWDNTVGPWERHLIPDRILSHLASRHMPAGTAVASASGCLDWALTARNRPPGSDLSSSRAVEAAAEKLGKQLRALEGLALKVIAVQPLSSVARGTAPLPPVPHPLAGGGGAAGLKAAAAGGGGGGLPRCLDPLEVLVTLESSGRWPDDPMAFKKMKAALGLQLGSSLAASYGHYVSASEEAVDVLVDGFAFRLVLYSGRDEAMLTARSNSTAAGTGATASNPAGLPPPPSVASASVGSGVLSPEESPLMLTWHHGLVSYVAGANASYGPAARLAGRWLAAHMMSYHVGPQTVELLMAAAYGGAGGPASPPPGSRLTGFLRFLQLLATWPWHLRPLVVDPARELKEPDRRALRKRFEERRAAGEAPPMYICTPRDRESRHWTSKGPSTAALQRLTLLAARSAALLELLLQPPAADPAAADDAASNSAAAAAAASAAPSGLPAEWAAVFATPATDFDAFVLLRKEALPHADLALVPPSSASASAKARRAASTSASLASAALASLLLPPGGSVRDVLSGSSGPVAGGGPGSNPAAAMDAPASGPDALSAALEDAPAAPPPPKRARAFLRAFPAAVVASRGPAALQKELLIGFDPVARLLRELFAAYGHMATFCVDALGGRAVGVRWAPEAFFPQPLRLNAAHTALPLTLTAPQPAQGQGAEAEGAGKKAGAGGAALTVPNVFAVFGEVRALGVGLVEDVVMPPSSARLRAAARRKAA
ncbi:hypothetical protein HYH03_005229 [Edaphochlamys debaryana]|uniref:U3 small nucleolar RNA-associated protein 22 n=1 Tax=Edaphochlamys debaryana TaxID=47281 RepID=A0A835Y8P3_9CHLO|nr:hypothetical protein HYH03_005229 [Edaphochlamys debaryana]|eukprot:KAG2496823.1 hypothetical protein HYH03_005229 [Edaphochlamys debaryana]